jgi:hypothetical protein
MSKKSLFALLSVLPIISLASSIDSKYIPRVYLSGYTGTELMTQGDILAPVYLAEDRIFAIYGQGRYSSVNKEFWENETWTGSAGLLYRQIMPKIGSVLGAYVLGDYSQALDGYKYWIISPGIESLGSVWDFRLNGYIPIGDKSWENVAWAQKIGDYKYIEFEKGTNNVYDHKLSYHEEVGVGGDVEIGRKLLKIDNVLIKGYAQGYYYNTNYNSDVIGIGVKVTAQPAEYITFLANYTYDNYQCNVFMLGVQIRLNDLFDHPNKSNKRIDENNLSNRLFDVVDRSYGNIGSGTTAPIIRGRPHDLGQGLYNFTTVFIGTNGADSPNDPDDFLFKKGTYGNPYTEDDVATRGMQGIFDEIHSDFANNVDIYFAPGIYGNNEDPVKFYNGMSVFGKDSSYALPANQSEQQILFIGTMELPGNNTLDSISVKNKDGIFAAGITARDASNIVLNNVEIGTLTNDGNYAAAVTMEHSDIAINHSKIYGYQNGVATIDDQINATGIKMTEGGSLAVSASEISAIANETSGLYDDSGNGYGVYADGKQEEITIAAGSYIFGQGEGGKDRSSNGYGILIGGNHHNDGIEADTSVYGNKLTISSSTSEGSGVGLNKKNNANFSANGYGVLVGYGYQHGDESYNNTVGTMSSIRDNAIKVDSSTLMGSGVITLGSGVKSTNSFSGNGYGLIIGSGSVSVSDIQNNGANFNVDLPIKNNEVSIVNNSNLSGKGENGNVKAIYSGSGYGLLLGNGSVVVEGDLRVLIKVDVSIHENTVTVTNSRLYADGDGFTHPYYGPSGHAFGMLVGYGDLFQATEANSTGINKNVTMNTVNFDHNHVSVNVGEMYGLSGRAWGVVVGGKYAKYDSLKPNKVYVSDSIVTLNSDRDETYGIYLSSGGKLVIDDYTLENITHTMHEGYFYIELGKKVYLGEDNVGNVNWQKAQ